MFGDVARVTASIHAVTHRYGECDEFGEGVLEFKSGLVATLAAGWLDLADPFSLLISGTDGYAYVYNGKLFFQSRRVAGANGQEPWTELPAGWPHAFDLFLDAVAGKPDVPLVAPREAVAACAVMETMYRAAARHRWLDFVPPEAAKA
jgi:hypothetical protein